MTDRNELEKLLAAATEGPWRFDHDWARIPTIHAPDGVEIANVLKLGFPHRDNRTTEQEANAALIVWLRNNAQHYLSLMDEVERLRSFDWRGRVRAATALEAADRITTLEAELAAMKARGDRLAESARHASLCNFITGLGDGLCDCGLDQALTEWRDQ